MKEHFRDEQQTVTHTQSQEAIFWKNGIGIFKLIILSFDRLKLNLCELGIESYTIPSSPRHY